MPWYLENLIPLSYRPRRTGGSPYEEAGIWRFGRNHRGEENLFERVVIVLRAISALAGAAVMAVSAAGSVGAAPGSATSLPVSVDAAAARSVGFTTDNVEWITAFPQHTGTSGGKLVGRYYYLTDSRGLFIYDVKDPEAPELVGELPALQGGTHAALAQEDPDTNGKILVTNGHNPSGSGAGGGNGALLVINVKDKAAPEVVGSLDLYDHTWTCILDCKYAIGRTGHVVDLRKPAKPERVADWRQHVFQPGYMHDFEEVAPGRVIGSGQPSLYLDMRNPRKPRELARLDPGFHSLGYHGALWPNKARDPLMLMGAEVAPPGSTNTAGSDCTSEEVHAVATYDARKVAAIDRKEFGPGKKGNSVGIQRQRSKAEFRKLKEWRIDGRGAYADGNAPAHTLYCGHWFDTHPKWKAGGILTIAHYDWGTRFLKVSKNGSMKQIGYFQPIAGYTGAAKWINNEIVFVHDYRRGLEILRFTNK